MSGDLAVWLNDERVGTLVRDRRGGFRFDSLPDASRLTVAAQGAERPWGRAFSRDWFDGLLPEGLQRQAAERNHHVADGDTFGLLSAIGWECAGAVSVLPEGRQPASGRYEALTADAVFERLDALPRLVAAIDEEVRLSLGGTQEKLLLRRSDDGWLLPLDGALSTHILKPEPERYPGLAAAEAWCLMAAGHVTATAHAELLVAPGHRPTIVVARYDRHVTADGLRRIHQEDLCQALGIPPTAKYANSTGPFEPSFGRLASILASRAADAPAELRRLLAQITVNLALGNADAHAKNFSLLHGGGGSVTLSPLYDVSPTVAFVPTQRRTSMPIAGKFVVAEITRGHLVAEADAWGIPRRIARQDVSETIEALKSAMAAADASIELPAAVRQAVATRFERLAASAWE